MASAFIYEISPRSCDESDELQFKFSPDKIDLTEVALDLLMESEPSNMDLKPLRRSEFVEDLKALLESE